MMYSEFTALAKRSITEADYHKIVEPVYNYHPAIPFKETAAKLYDLCGLQIFLDMTATAGRAAALQAEWNENRHKIDEIKERQDEINDELCRLSTAKPIAVQVTDKEG